ncbi:MAG: potassium channel family protein [Solirubrobacteraceae bacterium]
MTQSTQTARRARYGLLLGVILVAFVLQGVASPQAWEEVLVTALLGVTFLLSLWTADAKQIIVRPSVLIVMLLILLSIVEAANGHPASQAVRIANGLVVLLAPPAIVVGVMRSLRDRQTVTVEAVLGVLCVYILLGMFFAFLYGSIDSPPGEPFFANGATATAAHCLYYSFTTLTTVGYGDLSARSNLGHTLSVSEALLGQIYLVTVVSVIVANLGRRRPAPPT